jgi:NCS2 family nucleobase:cation symporter-2
MRKPTGVVYGVADRPSTAIIALSALQHVGVMFAYLIFPVLVMREAGSTSAGVASVVSMSLIALAIATLLQAAHNWPVGSGYLCQPVPSAVYLVPSMLAVRHGGLPLVFGMTVFAGVLQSVFSQAIRALRPLFPPEIAGLVVALIGMATGVVGIRTTMGIDAGTAAGAREVGVAFSTLGTAVALNVWTKGSLRLACVLIGIVVGYAVNGLLGGFSASDWQTLYSAPWFDSPAFLHAGWSFDAGLIVPFAVAALAASLKVMGNVTTCQKLNDAEWVRPDMRSIAKGVLADGIGTTLAGGLGTVGLNSASGAVGLSMATGVLSRYVAYGIAILLVVLAFFPVLGIVFFLMPRAVAGSALLFVAAFVLINGLEIMTSRLLDARRTFVIGFAFMGGLAVDLLPHSFANAPGWIRPLLVSSLVFGPVAALILNALFRLGIRKVQKFTVDPVAPDNYAIELFMETHGAAWGARRDVVDRATFNLMQSIETIVGGCEPQGPLEVEATFDEFNLNIRVSYTGPPLELPDKRPTNEEIMASEEGQRRLAGFMLRRYADRVAATHRGNRSTILFHFDH